MIEQIREEAAELLYGIASQDRDDFIGEYKVDVRKSRTWDELTKSSKAFWRERADQILSLKTGSLTLKELIEKYEKGELLEKAEDQELPIYWGSPDSRFYDYELDGYGEAQQDMLKDGWVKCKVKEE